MRSFFYRGRFIFIPVGIAAFITVTGLVVMSLWNVLMPVIFHLGVISFWQAIGVFILAKILFGFGKGGHRGGPWRHRMAEKFKNMSPEERERLKEKWSRCGGWNKWDMEESKVQSPEPKV